MVAVLLSLLPLIIGAAVGGPIWIIVSLILLRSRDGVVKATAFVVGAMTVRTMQFILFGYVFGVALNAYGPDGFDLIPPTLLLVTGLLLLITAARTWLRDEDEEDPESPPPKWMTALS